MCCQSTDDILHLLIDLSYIYTHTYVYHVIYPYMDIHSCRALSSNTIRHVRLSKLAAPTVEKSGVHNTSTDGKGQPQLPNGLKQLGHDSNLVKTIIKRGVSATYHPCKPFGFERGAWK